MRAKKGSFLILSGFLLIIAAVLLGICNMRESRQAGDQAAQTMDQLHELVVPAPSQWNGGDWSSNDALSSAGPDAEIPNFVLDPTMDMPEKRIDGQDYIGILTIPSLELELPIISSWSDQALKTAPARYHGSVYQDNLVLAGHNYKTHFGRIRRLHEGDQLIFTDMDGNVFVYEAVVLETLNANAVEQMCSDEWDLTLFTCTLGGSSRITLRCERIMN